MTNAELIQKIRAEIERNRQAIRVLNEYTAPEQMSKTCAIFQYSDSILSELLSFLSDLDSEKPTQGIDVTDFCKPIDPGIAQCIADHSWEMLGEEKSEKPVPKDLEEYASRAGFDYADNIVQESPGHRWNDHDVEFAHRDGILAGAKWQKEQMLKEAVEGKIAERVQGKLYARCQVPKTMEVEFGDKVRVIVLPKED